MPKSDDDEVEVAIIRGPGAKAFLASLHESDTDEDDGEEFTEEHHPGRRAGDKEDKGGKDEKKESFGSKFFAVK